MNFFHNSFTMSISKYLNDLKTIQENFLEFLENIENIEENFQLLQIKFEDTKIRDNKQDLRLFLHFISNICNNYFHGPTFFFKIEQTIRFFKDNIKKYYSNSEIFNIFKENKRIILFLINEKIITIDKSIAKTITSVEFSDKYYPQYFSPEIKPFANEKWFPKNKLIEELPDNFNELRIKGENSSFICKLIREDLVKDFISYYTKNCISSNAKINPSIYETNSFLLEEYNEFIGLFRSKNDITLIEYAAFFGSIQIFNFLKNENAKLKPLLWFYVIHSRNAELIHLLEELHVNPIMNGKNSYIGCFNESIKCHHNDIAYYFINNYLQNEDENSQNTLKQSLKYYNFTFLKNELINESSFCFMCKYDYYSLAKVFLATRDVEINSKENNEIQNHLF